MPLITKSDLLNGELRSVTYTLYSRMNIIAVFYVTSDHVGTWIFTDNKNENNFE
jgi:hypothetical protein